MAAVLAPTPHALHNRRAFSLPLSKCCHRQRLSVARTASAPLHRRTDRRSEYTPPVATNEWSFEQRIQEALNVLELMEAQGIEPEPSLFCILLKSCADAENLEFGKTIHSKIVGTELENDVFVVNNLINLYAKCRCYRTARKLFEKMPVKNAVSWTSIISMYSQSGFHEEALRLYNMMTSDGNVKPTVFTYTIALNSCAKLGYLAMGTEIHKDIKMDRCESDDFIVTALIDMYAKCGSIDEARQVFDKIDEPTVAACTAMIEGYNTNNQADNAMRFIRRILQSGLDLKVAKELGFTCMIRSCTMEATLRQGQEIHAHMIKFEYKPGLLTVNELILLYEKCNKMVLARRLFDELLVKNVKLWGRMISGYVRNGLNQEALELYLDMVAGDVEQNSFVLSCALDACTSIMGLEEGKQIHGRAIKTGYDLCDDSLDAKLVKLYTECRKVA
ncbi:PREDICTED: putative pentatricopeptide repeat-containing protein At3g13770, mitochondrial [Nelumbo nucifera]|uniref:Pentatricopeptide repeat-containing protein At3g13770, mitochondrial n=1 Tax=Nelumbo nucifera TaxID=4432 RepID=A0A1U8BIG0_NELNU|nr:PREDICTED: putative pentatricopeptide repeat-containing protein At3g13770, mitochondrial [Nelumbo nucifera]